MEDTMMVVLLVNDLVLKRDIDHGESEILCTDFERPKK